MGNQLCGLWKLSSAFAIFNFVSHDISIEFPTGEVLSADKNR